MHGQPNQNIRFFTLLFWWHSLQPGVCMGLKQASHHGCFVWWHEAGWHGRQLAILWSSINGITAKHALEEGSNDGDGWSC